jgi:hypothetical protein
MRKILLSLLLPCLLLGASRAVASPRHFAWSYGVDTGADGEVGLELWVSNNIFDLHHPESQSWDLWWGGTGTLTDWLEIGVFADADQDQDPEGSSGMHFDSLHTQLRFHVAAPLAIITDVTLGRGGRADSTPGGLVLVAGHHAIGAVDLIINAGGGYDYLASGPELDASTGATVKLGNYFHVGGEAFMHWFSDPNTVIAYAGPTLELAWGRMWLTGNVAIGQAAGNPSTCSRLIFAIAI